MHPVGTQNSPEATLRSQDPVPMDGASVPSKMPCPRVNARGAGRGRGRGRGRDTQVAGGRANGEFFYVLPKNRKKRFDVNNIVQYLRLWSDPPVSKRTTGQPRQSSTTRSSAARLNK